MKLCSEKNCRYLFISITSRAFSNMTRPACIKVKLEVWFFMCPKVEKESHISLCLKPVWPPLLPAFCLPEFLIPFVSVMEYENRKNLQKNERYQKWGTTILNFLILTKVQQKSQHQRILAVLNNTTLGIHLWQAMVIALCLVNTM